MSPGDFFDSHFFKTNRQRLRRLANQPLIVITASGLSQRNADNVYPFRQDSSFWYLSGIDWPDVIIVLSNEDEFLILPPHTDTSRAFDGCLEPEQASLRSGIKHILDWRAGWRRLEALIGGAGSVATLLPPPPRSRAGIYAQPARHNLVRRLRRRAPGLKLYDLRPHLASLRVIKQRPEIRALERAIAITVQAINYVYQKRGTYQYEYQVAADLNWQFATQAANFAYQPIVASGANACTLHYVANQGGLKPPQLLLIDCGAEVSGYAADITRTMPLGRPSRRQRAVWDAVRRAHRFGLSLIKPGAMLKGNEQAMEKFIGQELMGLGLISRPDRSAIRRYYPHALSHFLGLDVHDVGDPRKALQPGMVLTVEPGIYIPEEGIGVRIEDDVLVTSRGHRLLSGALPVLLP